MRRTRQIGFSSCVPVCVCVSSPRLELGKVPSGKPLSLLPYTNFLIKQNESLTHHITIIASSPCTHTHASLLLTSVLEATTSLCIRSYTFLFYLCGKRRPVLSIRRMLLSTPTQERPHSHFSQPSFSLLFRRRTQIRLVTSVTAYTHVGMLQLLVGPML